MFEDVGVGLDFVEDNQLFLSMKEVDDSNDDSSVRIVGSRCRIKNVVVMRYMELKLFVNM